MTQGIHGHGTTIAGATTGTIGEVLDIDGPGIEVDDIEFSSMDSSNKWKEFKPGMKDGGEVSFECVYFKTRDAAIRGGIGVEQNFTMTLPDGSTDIFAGYIKSVGRATPFSDGIKSSVTIKVSGAPAFTAG